MKTVTEIIDALNLRIKQLDAGIAILKMYPNTTVKHSETVKEELETLLWWIGE